MTIARGMRCASAVAFLFAASIALAQQPPLRVHGTVQSVNGSTIDLKPDSGSDMTVKIAGNVQVFGVMPATIADVKVGDFIAVGAMPQPDGSQKAILVTIFAEALRGVGEGFHPWTRPGSTMTNATVDSTVASASGQVVMVKYKGGQQKIIIGPDAKIIEYVPSEPSEIKAGAHIAIPRAEKSPDGTLQAARFYVGRDGVVPQ